MTVKYHTPSPRPRPLLSSFTSQQQPFRPLTSLLLAPSNGTLPEAVRANSYHIGQLNLNASQGDRQMAGKRELVVKEKTKNMLTFAVLAEAYKRRRMLIPPPTTTPATTRTTSKAGWLMQHDDL